MNKKKLLFYTILILIPILFFVLLEITLRAIDYGYDTRVFTEAQQGWLEVNPLLAKKYFRNVKKVPSTNKDVFRKVKPANGFRVFVLGGSSGAGYPFIPLGSFSRYIRKRLEIAYPNRQIEVVNMSMTAINSYSLRDMIDAVLEQKPDLILIYAGHNEYYGALGVGSMENLGTSPFVVNLVLKLENFKTFQLVQNFLSWVVLKIAGKPKAKTGTLMSRMAEKKKIPFNSELYKKGIHQFEVNMDYILSETKKSKVPVVLSTLACNLLGQKPFISEAYKNYPSANSIYAKVLKTLDENNIRLADSLFRYAKDLDMLRFRAPSSINKVIEKLARKYSYPVANSYEALSKASKQRIIGNDLMTDHLHPNLRGYQIIGKTIYETMAKHNLLLDEKPAVSFGFQDKLTVENFDFTELDSVIAAFKIKLLKNDWPFINPKNKIPTYKLIKLNNYIDTLAWQFDKGKIDWIEAHLKYAEYCFRNKDYDKYANAMKTVVSQFPIVSRFYETAATQLISVKELDKAYEFLLKQNKIIPSAFSNKWLGILNLKRGKVSASIYYFKKSLGYDNRDAQVYYNLAGAYVSKRNYAEALNIVNKAITVNPNYKEAINLKNQLESVLRNKKK